MNKILIVGTGGLAREFTSWFADRYRIVGYSSTNQAEHADYDLPGVLYPDLATPNQVDTDLAVIAIGTPAAKKKYYENLRELGFKFPCIAHPSSVIAKTAVLDEGVVISPHCVVSPNVTLGKMVYLNFCCGVGHDAVVESFVQINPGSQLGGYSRIGESTLIGSGSTIMQKVSIGNRATVASGAVVFASVEEGATVMGNPAKRMRVLEK